MIDYRLEEITNEDIDFVYTALSDRELYRLVRGPVHTPVSPESIAREMEVVPGAWWIIWVDHERIGWTRLTPKDVWSVIQGIVIVDPNYRHKGLGFDICWNMIYEIAFPLFREVYTTTFIYNKPSLKFINKLGFEPFVVEGEVMDFIKRKK
jgi:RimJ/RimL family protein N-acetyltransferase